MESEVPAPPDRVFTVFLQACDELPGFSAEAIEGTRVSVDAALSAHIFLTRPPENADHLRYRRQARRVASRTDGVAEIPAPC